MYIACTVYEVIANAVASERQVSASGRTQLHKQPDYGKRNCSSLFLYAE